MVERREEVRRAQGRANDHGELNHHRLEPGRPVPVAVETTGDDDFIGFALGFNPGDATNSSADYLLVDWKQGNQSFNFGSPSCTPGSLAPRGLAVSRVTGIPTADEFWGHVDFNSPTCSPLGAGLSQLARATTLGRTGWGDNQENTFAFEFNATSLKVFVNDVLQIDISGSFSDGRLAFYNFSQGAVRYSGFEVAPLVIDVEIDIKPGSDPNCFNNDGHDVIPVAILGSANFDVTDVDAGTVALAGLSVGVKGKSNKLMAHIEDVNGDGFDDLVVQIEDVDGTFTSGSGVATLMGNLFDGTPFQGSDEICVVP